jgi:hypothetical protein
MKNLVLVLAIFISSTKLAAQHVLPLQYDTLHPDFEMVLHGVADYGTSSIERRFANKFFYGGEITDDIKNASFDRHGGINRIGWDMQSEVEFRNYKTEKLGKGKYGWLLRGSVQSYGSMVYSKDLFGLLFYGNEAYLGEIIDFTGTRGSAWSFQKLGFGFIDKKSKSNISLNAYSIGSYANFSVVNSRLYQSESGDSLALSYKGSFESFSAEKMNRGWGFGVDADIRIPVELNEDKKIYIQFLMRNLGVGFLPNVTRHEADSSLSFQGFTFDQLLGSSNLVGDDFSWPDTLNIQKTVKNQFRILPGFLQVGKMIDEMNTAKIQSFYGVRIYPSVALLPLVYAGVHYSPVKWYSTGVHIVYGGYSGMRFGWYAALNFDKFNLGLATENVWGTVSGKGIGESLILRLRYKI